MCVLKLEEREGVKEREREKRRRERERERKRMSDKRIREKTVLVTLKLNRLLYCLLQTASQLVLQSMDDKFIACQLQMVFWREGGM